LRSLTRASVHKTVHYVDGRWPGSVQAFSPRSGDGIAIQAEACSALPVLKIGCAFHSEA
jgi:hypothetical protein